MRITLNRSRKANNILRQRHLREVRKRHLERAEDVRQTAKQTVKMFGQGMTESDIAQIYNDAEILAMELENCKCLDRKH